MKMKVLIENTRISIDEKALEYYPYYLAIWKDTFDHRVTVKRVLAQWAIALSSLSSGENAVYLPYYLNDQTCRYLKAELDGEDIILTDLPVVADGWAMDLDDLSREIYSEPEIIESFGDPEEPFPDSPAQLFGRWRAGDLIDALRNAEVAGR